MKVIQYLATSLNGLITLGDDGTDWVTQETMDDFGKLNNECGVVVMGRRTYEMFGEDFPQENCLNIVMTNDKQLLEKKMEGAFFTDKKPQEIIDFAQEKGFEKLFLVGGTKTNTAFLKAGLIDEIWVDIHPLIIGHGKYLFEQVADIDIKNLQIQESKLLDSGHVLLKYNLM